MELLAYQPEIDVNRRTDDILFNVRYLRGHIIDRANGLFDPAAEAEVLQQDITELAEADMHALAPVVMQRRDPASGYFIGLGTSTVENNIIGAQALDMDDGLNEFEFYRRVEEVTEEVSMLEPTTEARLRQGAKKLFISPAPTHHEADPDVALAHGYDDRTMLRLQTIAADGSRKWIQSYCVFDVPAPAWAAFLGDRYGVEVAPTALAVMQLSNRIDLETGPTEAILDTLLTGVSAYLDEDQRASVYRQLVQFQTDQERLRRHAVYYAADKLAFEKDLALSLDGMAGPALQKMLDATWHKLNAHDRRLVQSHSYGGNYYIDDDMARLLVRLKAVTGDNRAGLAAHNERTMQRVASKVGLEQ